MSSPATRKHINTTTPTAIATATPTATWTGRGAPSRAALMQLGGLDDTFESGSGEGGGGGAGGAGGESGHGNNGKRQGEGGFGDGRRGSSNEGAMPPNNSLDEHGKKKKKNMEMKIVDEKGARGDDEIISAAPRPSQEVGHAHVQPSNHGVAVVKRARALKKTYTSPYNRDHMWARRRANDTASGTGAVGGGGGGADSVGGRGDGGIDNSDKGRVRLMRGGAGGGAGIGHGGGWNSGTGKGASVGWTKWKSKHEQAKSPTTGSNPTTMRTTTNTTRARAANTTSPNARTAWTHE
jgi:hypothetical protein